MKAFHLLISACMLLATLGALAQDPVSPSREIIERLAESFADEYGEEMDLTPLLEDLERLMESPLNLNNTTRSELEGLHFLNTFQIENILNYREQVGQIFTIHELQGVEGFNPEVISDLEPFVEFLAPDTVAPSYLKQELHFRFAEVIEKASGFTPNDEGVTAYEGIRPAMLLKYRAEKGDKFRFGFTADHDPGEAFFKGSNTYGFDFYSAYFGYHGKKYLRQVYVGDYQVKTGQGVIQWSNYGIRKSVDGTGIRQTGQGLRPGTSTDENRLMRGAAASFELGDLELITYYSNHKVDANITTTDEQGKVTGVSSLQTSGYHRTEGEIADENALRIQQAGAALKYRFQRLAVGVNGLYEQYAAPLTLSDQLYNRYNFSGDRNYNLSTDFLWVFNRFTYFGEAAFSQSGGKALVTGMEAQPANEVAFSILYRDYARDFHSINGTSFAESSKNSNERGLYTGITIYPLARFKVSGYIDNYETYWMKFTSNGPVRGTDMMVQADYNPGRRMSMYLRFKSENNTEKSSASDPVKDDEKQQVSRARYQFNWQASEWLQLRFRTEWNAYTKADSTETGWMVFADVVARPIEKFSASARLAWFSTDGYNSRIYAYENDVPQYFYIPAFYNNGMRYYLNCSYQVLSKLTIYLKLSQLYYFDKEQTIGTGTTSLSNHKRTDFKIHLKYRF
jgi:hypothetical protein